MKLLTKISLVYLVIMVLVLLIGSIITFETVQDEVDAEHRRYLREQLDNLVPAIEQGGSISLLESHGKAAFERSVRVTFCRISRARGPASTSTPIELVRLSKRTDPSSGICFFSQS